MSCYCCCVKRLAVVLGFRLVAARWRVLVDLRESFAGGSVLWVGEDDEEGFDLWAAERVIGDGVGWTAEDGGRFVSDGLFFLREGEWMSWREGVVCWEEYLSRGKCAWGSSFLFFFAECERRWIGYWVGWVNCESLLGVDCEWRFWICF